MARKTVRSKWFTERQLCLNMYGKKEGANAGFGVHTGVFKTFKNFYGFLGSLLYNMIL